MAFVKPGWQFQVVDESVYFPRESIPLTEHELFVDLLRLTMDVQDIDERARLLRERFPQLADEHVDRLKRIHRPQQ